MLRSKVWIIGVCVALLSACDSHEEMHRAALPDADSPGAQLEQKYCADCHAPPLPNKHTAQEWPNVVYRMQDRRRDHALPNIPDEERAVLIEYLQAHAKG